MNSGLYALAGASATATAAACANRFPEPMTKVSKVYFGLSRAGSTRVRARPVAPVFSGGGGQARPDWVSSASSSGSSPATSAAYWSTGGSTVTATRISRPSSSDSAVVIIGRSRVSSTSLVNSFGAASSAVPSSRPSARVVRSQARCCGVTVLSARPSIACAHRDSRSTVASSGTRSLLPVATPLAVASPRCPHGSPQAVYLSPTDRVDDPRCDARSSPQPLARLWRTGGEAGGLAPYSARHTAHNRAQAVRRGTPFDRAGRGSVPLTGRESVRRIPAAGRAWVGRPGATEPSGPGIRRRPAALEPAREQAHLPAQQPPPGEDPRVPAAHAHPCRPRDHLRPPPQGPRRALR